MKTFYVAKAEEREIGKPWLTRESAEESVRYFKKCEYTNVRIEEMSSFKYLLERLAKQTLSKDALMEVADDFLEGIKLLSCGLLKVVLLLFFPVTILLSTVLQYKQMEKAVEDDENFRKTF